MSLVSMSGRVRTEFALNHRKSISWCTALTGRMYGQFMLSALNRKFSRMFGKPF
jgi:hypothetical protein